MLTVCERAGGNIWTMAQETRFGVELRRLRESRGLTQEELAERAGLTRNAIAALERGRRRRPYPHTIRALTDALLLSESERISLLDPMPIRDPAAPEPAAPAEAASLPMPPTPLVGREQEVEEVRSLLKRNGARLLTLTGSGGVGKTRLALEVASQTSGAFPDGVAFAWLAPIADPALIVPTVARTLGLL